jgi:hypothetical protein
MPANAEKVRDIAAALEVADWLADHRDVPDHQRLIAGMALLERFRECGWQVARIDRSAP